MPTMVRSVCRRLRRSARTAMAKALRWATLHLFGRAGRDGVELRRRGPARGIGLVRHDAAVLEPDDARTVLGDLRLVRDEHDCNAAFVLEALEDVHHLDA